MSSYENNIIRDDYTIVLSGAPVHQDGVTNPTVTIDIPNLDIERISSMITMITHLTSE